MERNDLLQKINSIIDGIDWRSCVGHDYKAAEANLSAYFENLGLNVPPVVWRDSPVDAQSTVGKSNRFVTWKIIHDAFSFLIMFEAYNGLSFSRSYPRNALEIIDRQDKVRGFESHAMRMVGTTGMVGLTHSFNSFLPTPIQTWTASPYDEAETFYEAHECAVKSAQSLEKARIFANQKLLQRYYDAVIYLCCSLYSGMGMCWITDEQIIATPRPIIHTDDRGRLHRENGPAVEWRRMKPSQIVASNGIIDDIGLSMPMQLWYYDGVEFDAHTILEPQSIKFKDVENVSNAERRRVLMKLYGYGRYLKDSRAKKVHGDDFGTLWWKDVPNDEPIVMVEVVNSTPEPDGTFKNYFLRVDPDMYDGDAGRIAHAAVASTWRNPDGSPVFNNWREYAPAVET